MNRVTACVIAHLLLFSVPQFSSANSPWASEPSDVESKGKPMQYADLPFEVTSFGAASAGGKVYLYGGHTGDAHSYSIDEQSNQMLALDLADSHAKWEVVGKGDRLQGLAFVPYKSNVIVIGGFTAMNEDGEEQDLHSQTRVRMFNTSSASWSELPPLPEGRSSHDAAILDGTIYVVGGWTMAGDKETVWHTTALKLNLEDNEPRWQEIAQPPFERRALSVVAHEDRIFVIGGMNHRGGPTKEVQIYDPKANTWTQGPEIAGQGSMAGFGAASWSVNGKLIVSSYEGDILRLNEDEDGWDKLGSMSESRFFHRLVPIGQDGLVAVGGANMESGKFLNLEVLQLR